MRWNEHNKLDLHPRPCAGYIELVSSPAHIGSQAGDTTAHSLEACPLSSEGPGTDISNQAQHCYSQLAEWTLATKYCLDRQIRADPGSLMSVVLLIS